MDLDVIIPAYNEEGNVDLLYDTLSRSLENLKYMLIFVDDGSIDNTYQKLKDIYNKDKKHVKVISFSRNFGKDAAIYAGMSASHAKYTCIIDADMQQHPKYIIEMYNFLEQNEDYDEVAMVNNYEDDSKSQKFFKNTFYKLMKNITKQNYVTGASDFRLMRSNVVKSILNMKENKRFTKGLFSWVGYKIHYINYKPSKRLSGKSKFNFKNQVKYAFEGILNFSIVPLHISCFVGGIISFISLIYFIIIIIQKLFFGIDVPGYASLMSVILILGGLILLVLGIIGEYVSRTYIEIKNRPIYIARRTLGFDDEIL